MASSDSESSVSVMSVPDEGPDTHASATHSRRRFFALGASAAAGLALSNTAEAQRPVGRPQPLPAGNAPGTDPSAQWQDPLLRLVRRITMGLAPADVALARQLGYNGYLDYQLRPAAMDDAVLESQIASRLPMMQMTADMLRTADGGEVAASWPTRRGIARRSRKRSCVNA